MRFFTSVFISIIWWEVVLRAVLGERVVSRGRTGRMRNIARRFRALAVRMGGVTYFGKLKYVDTSGANRDIILEEPKQYFDETGEAVQEGEVLLIRDVQQHQLLLVDLEEEERLRDRERSGGDRDGRAAVPGGGAATDRADGAEDSAPARDVPYSGDGGDA